MHRVTTDDGYILCLERLPKPKSRSVIYFQHGVIDSGFTWVAAGNTNSIAMTAHDSNYDVFLGNFRGNAPISHVNPNISSTKYWNFSVNHHAWNDIPAIIKYIQELKRQDLGDDDFEIIAVAHSMGGMAVLMYLVKCGMDAIPTGLSKAILLSPAGIHKDVIEIYNFLFFVLKKIYSHFFLDF